MNEKEKRRRERIIRSDIRTNGRLLYRKVPCPKCEELLDPEYGCLNCGWPNIQGKDNSIDDSVLGNT